MIDIIKALISRLFQDTGIRIVQANQTAPKPPLPYGTYNFTSPYIKGTGQPDVSYIEAGEGLQEKLTVTYQVTISLNFYGSNNEITIDQALQVRQWFLFFGQDFIESQGVAISQMGNAENRTTFLVDSYEYKHGFDVQLRFSEELIKEIDYYNRTENITV